LSLAAPPDARGDDLPTDPLAEAVLTAATAGSVSAQTAQLSSEIEAAVTEIAAAAMSGATALDAAAEAVAEQPAAVSPAVSVAEPAPDPDPVAAAEQAPPAAVAQTAAPAAPAPDAASEALNALSASESPAAPAPPAAEPTAPDTSEEQPAATSDSQYQDGNAAGINSDPTSAIQSAASDLESEVEPSADPGLTWVWTWTWGCGDSAGQSTSATTPSGTGTTWIWDWRWNCEPTAHSPPPCTTCNTNISIRLFSPGDNGAVSQTNSTTSTSIASNVTNIVQAAAQETASPAGTLSSAPAEPWSALPRPPPVASFGTFPDSVFAPVLPLPLPLPLPLSRLPELPFDVRPSADIPGLGAAIEEEIAAAIAALVPIPGDTEAIPPDRPALSTREGTKARKSGVVLGRRWSAPDLPAFASSGFSELPAPRPALLQKRSRSATATRAEPAGRRAAGTPLPRAPFAAGSNLSVASSAPGSGSPGTPVAILVGVLLLVAPHAARWLRVAAAPRPRRAHVRRPERPG
jgi:hypothetical protein